MRWVLKQSDSAATSRLAAEAGIPEVLARLLIARGIASAEQVKHFLQPSLDHLHSPYLMRGMREAVERLQRAIAQQERILIYGDYDVDGTTAIVILKKAIEICGGAAEYYIPHRIREGYGMRDEVIERAAADGTRLVISVDTGIRAFAAAEAAARVGLDLIVTDHHLPEGSGVPRALAVLNPNQEGCEYPCKSLCGAGVALKIAQALLEARDEQDARRRLLPSFLKIAAIATIADAVPLSGENRVFAALGLAGLRDPRNVGLRALMQSAQLAERQRRLTASDIAFRLAPRINAAGRMDIAKTVIELFDCREVERATQLAQHLDRLNADRQQTERDIVLAIEKRLADDPTIAQASCLVLAGEGWHRGVIGIAATRAVERTGRPALVLSIEGEQAHGSGRSIPAFHLLDALESCAGLFTRFGGHAHAVGFSLPAERVPELKAHLEAYASARLTPEDFVFQLGIAAEIGFADITPELILALEQMQPFGVGNPEPVFTAHSLRVAAPPRVLKEKHAKLRLVGGSRGFDALAWGMAERVTAEGLLVNDMLDLAFTLEENKHPEFGGIQLIVKDLRRAQPAVAESGACMASAS